MDLRPYKTVIANAIARGGETPEEIAEQVILRVEIAAEILNPCPAPKIPPRIETSRTYARIQPEAAPSAPIAPPSGLLGTSVDPSPEEELCSIDDLMSAVSRYLPATITVNPFGKDLVLTRFSQKQDALKMIRVMYRIEGQDIGPQVNLSTYRPFNPAEVVREIEQQASKLYTATQRRIEPPPPKPVSYDNLENSLASMGTGASTPRDTDALAGIIQSDRSSWDRFAKEETRINEV